GDPSEGRVLAERKETTPGAQVRREMGRGDDDHENGGRVAERADRPPRPGDATDDPLDALGEDDQQEWRDEPDVRGVREVLDGRDDGGADGGREQDEARLVGPLPRR